MKLPVDEYRDRLPADARAEFDALLMAERPVWNLAGVLFGPQHSFVSDRSKFKTGVCSRRAGKSIGAAADLVDTALAKPGSANPYITLSRVNAKRIIWEPLKALCRDYGLDATASESELTLRFPNGSTIHLAGANDRGAIENFRGLAIGKAVLDEAQALPAYIETLVDDVLVPALMDFDGSISVIGTPGPVPAGYFHDCVKSAGWSHHRWTVWDNPWIERKSGKPPEHFLEAELARRGVTRDDPTIRREWFAEWKEDPEALVFKFDRVRNTFRDLPKSLAGWRHVIGVDLGYHDADAICVLAYAADVPDVHVVREWTGAKQGITPLGERLRALLAEFRDTTALVMDFGGLGEKIAVELQARLSLPVKAAEKAQKFAHIELLNDALRTGRVLFRPDSLFAHDSMLVEWDRDRTRPDRLVVSDRFHSDICDAVLYAYRESLHWMHRPGAPAPARPGTPEALLEEQRRLKEAAVKKSLRRQVASFPGDDYLG